MWHRLARGDSTAIAGFNEPFASISHLRSQTWISSKIRNLPRLNSDILSSVLDVSCTIELFVRKPPYSDCWSWRDNCPDLFMEA